jgi:hypothetical protein
MDVKDAAEDLEGARAGIIILAPDMMGFSKLADGGPTREGSKMAETGIPGGSG